MLRTCVCAYNGNDDDDDDDGGGGGGDNKGQSNLAIGGIAASGGSDPQITSRGTPFREGEIV